LAFRRTAAKTGERGIAMIAATDLIIGIDVGSTTVKCVVIDPDTAALRWRRYERHGTRQAEKLAEMLAAIEADFADVPPFRMRAFITGSGAAPLTEPLGARFVQEVNAVTIAVERLHPDASSVIELGGQDAKIILFRTDPKTQERSVITSMNDKCASGTGATIDKCLSKVGMAREALAALRFDPARLHRVAARCGVFAETDIVNLIKAGVPPEEAMNSLADAIVLQNLTMLARGHTLWPKVLLLGGPNTFLPFLQASWRRRISELWQQRNIARGDEPIEDLVVVPANAEYFAAAGAALFGLGERASGGVYRGLDSLNQFINHGRKARLAQQAGPPLLAPGETAEGFARSVAPPRFEPRRFGPGSRLDAYIGFDGGSTTSKAVLLDEDGKIVAKEYLTSGGNPISDAKEILARLRNGVVGQGCALTVRGFGVTGYAADVLDAALLADANVVETVAHMLSARHCCGDDVDVICDVGGQDIKVLFLENSAIKSFRLSNQCSAGNGMLLQSMADQFGVKIEDFAATAFRAEISPRFSYGCAVFLDTDRVTFQKEGFSREELFAGLAMVLPKNVWQYVVQIPRLAELGRNFVLQGGTQRNLAAVKAQMDYIAARVPDARILVHPHCGEAGAIGAALEARRLVSRCGKSRFIGVQAAIDLTYRTRTDETTRCRSCTNECLRTFIDTRSPDGREARYIAGFACEKGTVESKSAVIAFNQARKRLAESHPNLLAFAADAAFRHIYPVAPLPESGTPVADVTVRRCLFGYGPVLRRPCIRPFVRSGADAAGRRRSLRIGIPRVLEVYRLAPFLRAYLEALGMERQNIVFSDETSETLWAEGGRFGAVDSCFPSKVAIAHVHNLLVHKHRRKPLHYLWFPAINSIETFVSYTIAATSCPVVAGAPKVVEAALTKETDPFAASGIGYVPDVLDFELPNLLRQQLLETWQTRLGITEHENAWAVAEGFRVLQLFDAELQRRGREMLDAAERDGTLVLLVLGRPYHNDPGLNHRVLEELQALGYPVLAMAAIPREPTYLARFFDRDLADGRIADVFDVRDVWPENYAAATVQKVWAAKFAARHPNVAVLDLSSFKCGNDSPAFGLIDRIVAISRTPYLALHDLDANKPGGSIKIRVQTFAYTLALYQERVADRRRSEAASTPARSATAALPAMP
jgi:activator of 2-hydroxyglutaryl-CoA dehydratase/predicted nucleotide-binding protein (sugar kinase/HSP70/actin superfamily)